MQMRGGGARRPFFVLFLGIFFYFLFFIFTVFGVFFVLGANGPKKTKFHKKVSLHFKLNKQNYALQHSSSIFVHCLQKD